MPSITSSAFVPVMRNSGSGPTGPSASIASNTATFPLSNRHSARQSDSPSMPGYGWSSAATTSRSPPSHMRRGRSQCEPVSMAAPPPDGRGGGGGGGGGGGPPPPPAAAGGGPPGAPPP